VQIKLFEANIRTGREGYYKRVRSTEKETELDVQVFDNDNSVGDGGQHSKILSTASQALTSKSDTIDALDLPFFKIGSFSSSKRPALSLMPPGSSSGAASTAAAMSVDGAVDPCDAMGAPMTSMHDDDHRSDDDGSSDDNENVASNGIGNALDVLSIAFGPMPKVKAAAKPAAAKPQPKRDAKTKAKDKDKTGAGTNKRKANATEIMQLPPTKQPRTQQNQSKASDEMMLKEFKDSLDQVKKSVFSKIVSTDAESVLTDKIKTAQKEIAGFVAKVNAKKKSLNRRNDATELIESLLSMRNEAFDVQLLCMKLVNNSFEVKDMDDLTSTSASWTIPDMVFKRAWKLQALIYVEALKNYRLSSDSVM
jgi:hypothetical protein